MGRTNPTYRDSLRAIERDWSKYRRALRRPDQQHFDRLFEQAREHADASGYLNHQFVEQPFLVSVMLEQEKRLDTLAERLDALEERDDERGESSEGDEKSTNDANDPGPHRR
ncbi:hypothetical protein ACFQJC_07340 [Haloferax namakaokahaiae]|uniref:DUF8156 domain-containing protein n=1 Tax=Haloferax namakaokahaiae TaxID=1748331 RepID=A0ABD5ZDF7_9EURY